MKETIKMYFAKLPWTVTEEFFSGFLRAHGVEPLVPIQFSKHTTGKFAGKRNGVAFIIIDPAHVAACLALNGAQCGTQKIVCEISRWDAQKVQKLCPEFELDPDDNSDFAAAMRRLEIPHHVLSSR